MRTPKLSSKLLNGYTISLILHVIILLLMVLYTLTPLLPPRWHSFEWENNSQVIDNLTIANIVTKPGEPSIAQEPAQLQPQSGTISTQEEAISIPQESISDNPSPVIAAPRINTNTEGKVNIPRNRGISNLRNVGIPNSSGNIGFSSNLEDGNGEAYIISQPKPNLVPDAEGEVYLQFKLLQNGTVNMNSVTVLSYTSSVYVEAVKQVMPQWRFGFTKAFNSDRQYRIRCRFIVNE